MITSLAIIILLGLSFAELCTKLRVPRIIGLLVMGILLGPFVLNWLDPLLLDRSDELNLIALIIILLKFGLSLNWKEVKKLGNRVFLLAFIPPLFEFLAFFFFTPLFFKISFIESALLGSILIAISPSVVVPRMMILMEKGYGTKYKLPQIIIGSASVNNVFILLLFTSFLSLTRGENIKMLSYFTTPVGLLSGMGAGFIVGTLLSLFFEFAYYQKTPIRNSYKAIILTGFAFLFFGIEQWLKGIFPFSGILAILAMAAILQVRTHFEVINRLNQKFGKIWLMAEVLLFVLVGAMLDIKGTLQVAPKALLLLFITLSFRSLGIFLTLIKSKFNYRERAFCMITLLPKATIHAAIGAIPLALEIKSGALIFSIVVVAIATTAPLCTLFIELTYKKLLDYHPEK